MSLAELYRILGLEQQDVAALLTKEKKKAKINQALREQAILYHPDRNSDSTARMQQINDARDKLIAYIDHGTPIEEAVFQYHDFPHGYQARHQKSLYEMFTAQRSDFEIEDKDIFSEDDYSDKRDPREFSTIKRGNLLFKFASGGKGSFTLYCLLIDREKGETHPLITINAARSFGFFSQGREFEDFSKFSINDFICAVEVEDQAMHYTRLDTSLEESFLRSLEFQILLREAESGGLQQPEKAIRDLKLELYGPTYKAITALRDFLTKLQEKEKGVADIDEFATLQANLLDALRHPVRSKERVFSFVSNRLKEVVQNSMVEFSKEVKTKTLELISTIHRLVDSTNIDPMTKALTFIYKFCTENKTRYIEWISSIRWDAEKQVKQISESGKLSPSQIILSLSQELVAAWLRSCQAVQVTAPEPVPTPESVPKPEPISISGQNSTLEQGYVSVHDAYEHALSELHEELNQEGLNDEIKKKTEKLIAQVLKLKKKGEDIELLKNILLSTRDLLAGCESPQTYQAHAAKFQGAASLNRQILGGLMMALGAAILAAGIIMAVALPVSLPITAAVAVGGGATLAAGSGFFAKGRQSGLYKNIIELAEAKAQTQPQNI